MQCTPLPALSRGRCAARVAAGALALALVAACGGGSGQPSPWRDALHRRSSVPGLGWELVPGAAVQVDGVTVHTSSIGARDGEPVEGDDVFRVAVLGGCFAFGRGLDDDQVWPRVLEDQLHASFLVGGRKVDLMDLAVCGYDAAQQAIVLERRALPRSPWLVVLEHSFADPAAPGVTALRSLAGEEAAPSIEAQHALGGAPWKATVAAWQHVRELCGPRNLPMVLVIVPRLDGSPWKDYPYRALHEQVTREAQHHGFEVFDLLGDFSEEDPATLVRAPGAAAPGADPFPSAKAGSIAAEQFKRFLFSSGVLQRVLEAH